MAETISTRPEDTVSVGSRISWGAVLAGAVVALSVYLVLIMLGTALGLTAGGWARLETISIGAMIWAVISICLSLWCGGCVTSQLTAGETKTEAMVHGVILWGTVVAMLWGLAAMGVSAGFSAMLSASYAGSAVARNADANWQEDLRSAGVSQESINAIDTRIREAKQEVRKATADPEGTTAEVNEAAEKARQNMALVTWWSLFGTLLSMGAAIWGATAAAGPHTSTYLRMGTGATRHGGVEKSREYVTQV